MGSVTGASAAVFTTAEAILRGVAGVTLLLGDGRRRDDSLSAEALPLLYLDLCRVLGCVRYWGSRDLIRRYSWGMVGDADALFPIVAASQAEQNDQRAGGDNPIPSIHFWVSYIRAIAG